MSLTKMLVLITLGALTVLAATGCGPAGSHSAAGQQFNAAVAHVACPADHRGGTLRCGATDAPDSFDPADMYYAWVLNFSRLYGRSLVTYVAGPHGTRTVPDLADSLGAPSDSGRTWTYHLRRGVRFEDGTPVTSRDVAYAVLRALDKGKYPKGPTYFNDWLALPRAFKSVYLTPGVDVRSAIETPDDRTIVFHLQRPFAGFDNFAALPATVPVPKAKDTGERYGLHVVASGPYRFTQVRPGIFYGLARNPAWDPATDPVRRALPDSIAVWCHCEAGDLDRRLIAGLLDVDLSGSGVQPATLSRVMGDPELRARADNPDVAMTLYACFIPDVPPLDRADVRRALICATDRRTLQVAYGGPMAGGSVATSLLPPVIDGHTGFDLYPPDSTGSGDLARARRLLASAGVANGFDLHIAYRLGRAREKAAAEALQQAWARIGVRAELEGFEASQYFARYVGKPEFNREKQIGVALNAWGADWLDGWAFLDQITDSRSIREQGNSNLGIRDSSIDAMLDRAIATADATSRNVYWGRIDRRVMEQAYVLPGVWAKVLLLRGAHLTNVSMNDVFGMYDYALLGVR